MSFRHEDPGQPAFSGVFSGTFFSVMLLALLGFLGMRSLWPHGLSSRPEPRPVEPVGELSPEELSTVALFERASRSAVSIQASNVRRYRGELSPTEVTQDTGSGFVWDEDGHVVTNLHVVKDGTLYTVRFQDGTAYRAEFVGAAPDYDLAVLRVQAPPETFTPLPLGRSGGLRVGQRTFAIGYPFGLEQTLTTGVCSGLDRAIQSMSGLAIHGVIQTDAAINPGNSGGPLLDSSGRLIGVNTAIASATGANTGVGFAVPVDTVNRIVPRILQEGNIERAGLGIVIGDDLLAADAGLQGAVVGGVSRSGPAQRAGMVGVTQTEEGALVLGDVIVGIDDQEIRRAADLYQAFEVYRAGEDVLVRVNRAGPSGRHVEELSIRLVPLR